MKEKDSFVYNQKNGGFKERKKRTVHHSKISKKIFP